jgi:hypothetical protein
LFPFFEGDKSNWALSSETKFHIDLQLYKIMTDQQI